MEDVNEIGNGSYAKACLEFRDRLLLFGGSDPVIWNGTTFPG
jgi:hypothetical protein